MVMREKPFDASLLTTYLGCSTRQAAELLGVTHQAVHRWNTGVMFTEAQAEDYAHRLHAHPCEIWPNWWADCPYEPA